MSKLTPISVHDLGDYLREQRQSAQLSLRQLAAAAGISNPYLSQIERGLKRPSAEILQALAKGLRISAESLYVRAGILEELHGLAVREADVRSAILADAQLTNRQRGVLLDVYDTFVAERRTALEVNGSRGATTGTTAEDHRVAAEDHGVAAEDHGVAAEDHGVAAEDHRATAETEHTSAETERAETERAETVRTTAETEGATPNTRPVRRSHPTTPEPAAMNTTTQGE